MSTLSGRCVSVPASSPQSPLIVHGAGVVSSRSVERCRSTLPPTFSSPSGMQSGRSGWSAGSRRNVSPRSLVSTRATSAMSSAGAGTWGWSTSTGSPGRSRSTCRPSWPVWRHSAAARSRAPPRSPRQRLRRSTCPPRREAAHRCHGTETIATVALRWPCADHRQLSRLSVPLWRGHRPTRQPREPHRPRRRSPRRDRDRRGRAVPGASR